MDPQCRDISTVLQTLYTLYSNTNTNFESRKVASTWLTQLQASIDAWDIAHQILSLNNDTEYVNYFAANTMHSKVRDSFNELPKDAHMALRDSLLHHLTLRAAKPSPVSMQLVLALADLALQMEGWETVIDDVIAKFSTDVANVPTLLDLLLVLPEEMNCRALRLGTNRRARLTEMFTRSCRTVLELLLVSLTHWPNDVEIKTRVFQCLSSWISLRSFPVEEVANSSLVTAPFQTLHDLSNTPDKLYEAAADCICASLYVCFDVSNFEPLALVLQHNVNQLLPVFVTVIETENSLRANSLTRVFTEMAESFLFNIVHYPDTSLGSLKTLDLLLVVAKHYDFELIDITFQVWYKLAEMVKKLKDVDTSNRFIAHINELISALVKHCQLNDDLGQTEVPDEKGDFADFRYNVGELMHDMVFIVGSVDIFQQLYSVICTPGQTWYVTEACLFLMCSIASLVKKDESAVLPIALPVLLSIPPSAHYAVRGTTLRLIGELSLWISKHPDILNDVLKFLQDGLLVRPLASVSAVGIQNLCRYCKGQMANLFDTLLEVVRLADTLGITNNSVIGLLTGSVNILLDQPSDKVSVGLHGLCALNIQKITEIVQTRPAIQANCATDPALWTDRITAVFRECIYTPSPGTTHPALESAKEALPAIFAVLDIYKNDPRIVERSCRCLRFMLRCLRSHAATIIDQIISVSITLYQQCHHSCFLYLGSIIVDEFGTNPVNHSGLLAMTESFVTVSFSLLSGPTGLIDHPDTIDDMFRLCARMIQRSPLVFLHSPIALTATQCGLAASQHMHRDAFTSVMKYFKDLIHLPFDEGFTEPDHSEIAMLTMQALADHGLNLVNNLVKGFVSLPSDMLTESAYLFWVILHNYMEYAYKWVESVVSQLDSSKITDNQKMKFLHSIRQSSTEENSEGLERDVRDLARIFR